MIGPPPSSPLFPHPPLSRSPLPILGKRRPRHSPDFGGRRLCSLGLHQQQAAKAATAEVRDRKSTRLNSSHLGIPYAVFFLKKKNHNWHEPNRFATMSAQTAT